MSLWSALRRIVRLDCSPPEDAGYESFLRVVEQSADVICRLVDGEFRYVSPSAATVFGWDPQALVGTNGMHVIHEDDRPLVEAAIGRLVSGKQSKQVIHARAICGDGSLKWMEPKSHVEMVGSTSEIVLILRDITERKQLEQELQTMALQDGLTGLANRRAFDRGLEHEWRRTLRTGGEMALVLLDIDHFKQFNDLYGHQAGDDCLRAVADCIRQSGRRPTDMICRYGGEEIVIILGDTDSNAAVLMASDILARVESLGIPHHGSSCSPHVTASIGVAAAIARLGGTMQMPEGLLQAADHALYKAKAGGRNRVEQSILIAPSEQKLPQ